MPLEQLLNRPCTLLLRDSTGDKDDYGNEKTGDPTEVETVCELQQQRRDEQDDQGETSDTTWLVILPAGTEIDTGDAIQIDGYVYELVGAPWRARNPRTQAESHVEATARRAAGAENAS